ncbi:hypothetical protein [Microbacterium sp. NPDC055357]
MPSSTKPGKKPICFVISPIGGSGSEVRKAADQVLKHLIRKALEEDYEIKRGDEDSNPGSITSQIIESIIEADLIVADLSGYNPNVYYEVAIAHGYARPTVHIQRDDEEPAFDLKDMRLIQYNVQDPDELEIAQKALGDFARYALTNPAKVRTPLTDARLFVQLGDSADPVAQSNLEVMEQLRSLRTEVRRAVGGNPRPGRTGNPDIPSIRKVVERALARGALVPGDFESVITPRTSSGFDNWSRKMLSSVTGEDDEDYLNDTLFNPEVAGALPDDPDDPAF